MSVRVSVVDEDLLGAMVSGFAGMPAASASTLDVHVEASVFGLAETTVTLPATMGDSSVKLVERLWC